VREREAKLKIKSLLTRPTLLEMLTNSFQAVSISKGARKSLNVRSPHALKFIEITALVPFLTAIAPESPTKPGK
jgi:hypothetical protein